MHSQFFFSRSPKRASCLDDCVARRIPRSVQTRWNFHSRIVSTVFEHKADLRRCFELIINTWKRDQVNVCEANGLLHWLQGRNFSIYLNFFLQLMPHVKIFYMLNCKSTRSVLHSFGHAYKILLSPLAM